MAVTGVSTSSVVPIIVTVQHSVQSAAVGRDFDSIATAKTASVGND